jgi:hypothetical protein
MGGSSYSLHRAFPDDFPADGILRSLEFLHGAHPGSHISFVSGVGTHSKTVAYGSNRANFSFIAGGIVPGVLVPKPDFPRRTGRSCGERTNTSSTSPAATSSWSTRRTSWCAVPSSGGVRRRLEHDSSGWAQRAIHAEGATPFQPGATPQESETCPVRAESPDDESGFQPSFPAPETLGRYPRLALGLGLRPASAAACNDKCRLHGRRK